MKKKLLAIAVGVAMAPAVALADGASVYGTINISYDQLNIDSGDGTPHFQTLTSNKSHFGIRGESDLDIGGLAAFYQLEFGVNPTQAPRTGAGGPGGIFGVIDGAELLAARDSFVGLKGDFGAVQAGRFNTPVRELGNMVDQFHDQVYADLSIVLPGQRRADEIIQYTSPKLMDMLTVTYAGILSKDNEDVTGSGNDNHGLAAHSISVLADLGDFYAGLGYDYNYAGEADLTAIEGGAGVDTFGIDSMDILRFVAGARMDALEFGFLYQVASSNLDGDVTGDPDDEDLKDTTIALSVGFYLTDDIKLKAQWADTKASEMEDMDENLQAIGVDYRLGRNTTAYFQASEVKVDGDRDAAGFGVGVKHRF